MKYQIITVGEPSLAFAREGFTLYTERLARMHSVTLTHVRDDARSEQKIIDLLAGAHHSFLCDERGRQYTSRGFADRIEALALHGDSTFAFVIGGADGHSDHLRSQADEMISLGAMTLPHDMAMLVLAEALYRTATISAGHPYHRD